MADQPTQPSTEAAPKKVTPIEVTKPPIKPLTNEETKAAIDAFNSSSDDKAPVDKPTVLLKATKPIEVAKPEPAKEVKPVAEVKDPKEMFDYTGCQTHVVKEGEALFDVAQQYHVAMQQLRYFNHVNKATMRIKTGQTLYIPKEPVYVPTGK